MFLKKLVHYEWIQIPFCCLFAVSGGYLLSLGTVSGVVSPLAAALAGVCSPLYAFCILVGCVISYCLQNTPEEMQFLLACLSAVFCTRIFFCDNHKPWVTGVFVTLTCILAGIMLNFFIQTKEVKIPVYVLESFLIGIASFFLTDAKENLKEHQKIQLGAGKSFTYAVCYLLFITALCGIDLKFCNPGRIAGITVTLLSAKQFRQSAGTLCGALTACGVVLCGVSLGTPLLFLPVTAMLAGFLFRLPNAFWIPVFFFMQLGSSAVLDSSIEIIRILAELVISCTLYAVFCQVPFRNYFSFPVNAPAGQRQVIAQETFLSQEMQELREEVSAVMRHLTVSEPPDPIQQVRACLCQHCKYCQVCWKQNKSRTEQAFQQMLHTPFVTAESLENCPERKHIADMMSVFIQRRTVREMQNVNLMQNREMTLSYLQLMEHLTADSARRRSFQFCDAETAIFRKILQRCAVTAENCFIYKLRGGRYAGEIFSTQKEFPLATIQELLSRQLETEMKAFAVPQKNLTRYCFYAVPEYQLNYAIKSRNAPAYERCGDHADAFRDSAGNQYLVISDGMGSGSSASLASRIAVQTFRNLVCCEMPPDSAIRLMNILLMTETNTENFATLDIVFLHADTGEITFYKSGSAAAFFRHHTRIQQIVCRSFPLGMMPDATPYRTKVQAQNGDKILMFSDGLREREYPWLKQLLSRKATPEQIVSAIFEKTETDVTLKDDLTVISACVQSRTSAATISLANKKTQNSVSSTL